METRFAAAETEIRDAIQNEARSHQEYFKWAQEKNKKETLELQAAHKVEMDQSKAQLRQAILELTQLALDEKQSARWQRIFNSGLKQIAAQEEVLRCQQDQQTLLESVVAVERARCASELCSLRIELEAQHADEMEALREEMLATAQHDRDFLKSQCVDRCEEITVNSDLKIEMAVERARRAEEETEAIEMMTDAEIRGMRLEMERMAEMQNTLEEALQEAHSSIKSSSEERDKAEVAWNLERQRLQEEKEAILRGHTRELTAASGALKDEVEKRLAAQVGEMANSVFAVIDAACEDMKPDDGPKEAPAEAKPSDNSVMESVLASLEAKVSLAMASYTKHKHELTQWRSLVAYLPEGAFNSADESTSVFLQGVEAAVKRSAEADNAIAKASQDREGAISAATDAQNALTSTMEKLSAAKKEISTMKEGREMFEAGCMGATVAFIKGAKGHLDTVGQLLSELEMRTKWQAATSGLQDLNDLPGKISEVRRALASINISLPGPGNVSASQNSTNTETKSANPSLPITLNRQVDATPAVPQDVIDQMKRALAREKMLLERINWLESSTKWTSEEKEAQYMDMILSDELK